MRLIVKFSRKNLGANTARRFYPLRNWEIKLKSIEIVLLILESVLLVATVVLLLYSLKEGRSRKKLLLEVGRAAKILTRQEYFLTVMDSMMEAKADVIGFITGRPPLGDDEKRVKSIVVNIERLSKRGVKVKYLIPKLHDRLHVGYLYSKAGAEVRYGTCAIANDIRYIVVDDKLVVAGIPESTGETEATKKGYRIPSDSLASILKEHFCRCWEEGVVYEEYLKEIIKQTGVTPKLLGKELQIDEKELVKHS
ncbi:MAG: hypothetical protein C4570_09205 [Ammonifex sp.]|nr:MAG: hypothetical protein C4570_09205 [Ammonifex sp.]